MARPPALLAVALVGCVIASCSACETVTCPTEEPAALTLAPSDGGFRVALSVSNYFEYLERAKIGFLDGATAACTPRQVQALLGRHGATEVFVRVSTQRAKVAGGANAAKPGNDYSLATAKQRAGLAKSLGLPLNVELGLFGSYGDVVCQVPPRFDEYPELPPLPGPWHTLTVAQMESALTAYTALVARELLATGVRVDVWDLGNEVDFGTAGVAVKPLEFPGYECDTAEGGPGWYRAPDAVDPALGAQSVGALLALGDAERLDWLKQHLWPYEARLLAAAAAGVRSVDPTARFSTHLSRSTVPSHVRGFFEAMADHGFLVDEAGVSFYPSADPQPADRLAVFKEMVAAVRAWKPVPLFVAEYSYPAERMSSGPFATWNNEQPGHPLTPAGQASLLRALVEWGSQNGLSGVRPWAPELCAGDWAPMSLFARSGSVCRPRPALDAVSEGLRAAGR